jgi:hypothetical protein
MQMIVINVAFLGKSIRQHSMQHDVILQTVLRTSKERESMQSLPNGSLSLNTPPSLLNANIITYVHIGIACVCKIQLYWDNSDYRRR